MPSIDPLMSSVVSFYGEGEYKSFSPQGAIPGVAAHEAENHRYFERVAAVSGQIPSDATTQLKFAYNPATGRVEVVGGESRVELINETPRNGQRVGPRTVIIDPSKDPNSPQNLAKARQAGPAGGRRKGAQQDPDTKLVGQLSTMRATLSTQLGRLDAELARRKNGVAPGGPVAARPTAPPPAAPPPQAAAAPVPAPPPASAVTPAPADTAAPAPTDATAPIPPSAAAGAAPPNTPPQPGKAPDAPPGIPGEMQLHNDVRRQAAGVIGLGGRRPPAPPAVRAGAPALPTTAGGGAAVRGVGDDAARRQAAQDAARMQAASQAAGPPAPSDAQMGDLESRRQDLMQRLQHVDEALNKLSEDIQKRLNGLMMGTVNEIENQAGAVAVAAVGMRPEMGGGAADLSGSSLAGGNGANASAPPAIGDVLPGIGGLPPAPATPPAMPGIGPVTAPPPPAAAAGADTATPPPATSNYTAAGLPQIAGALGILVNNVA